MQSYRNQSIDLRLYKLNHFFPNAPFLYSLKTSENCRVFWCFQRVEEGFIGGKWVKLIDRTESVSIGLSGFCRLVQTWLAMMRTFWVFHILEPRKMTFPTSSLCYAMAGLPGNSSATKQDNLYHSFFAAFLFHVTITFYWYTSLEWPINWKSTVMETFSSSDGGFQGGFLSQYFLCYLIFLN